jgi:hypothetical protein
MFDGAPLLGGWSKGAMSVDGQCDSFVMRRKSEEPLSNRARELGK